MTTIRCCWCDNDERRPGTRRDGVSNCPQPRKSEFLADNDRPPHGQKESDANPPPLFLPLSEKADFPGVAITHERRPRPAAPPDCRVPMRLRLELARRRRAGEEWSDSTFGALARDAVHGLDAGERHRWLLTFHEQRGLWQGAYEHSITWRRPLDPELLEAP